MKGSNRAPRGMTRPAPVLDPRLDYCLAPIEIFVTAGANPITLTSSRVAAVVSAAGANITSVLPPGTYPGQEVTLRSAGNSAGHTWVVAGVFGGSIAVSSRVTFATDGDWVLLKWDDEGPFWIPFVQGGGPVYA